MELKVFCSNLEQMHELMWNLRDFVVFWITLSYYDFKEGPQIFGQCSAQFYVQLALKLSSLN